MKNLYIPLQLLSLVTLLFVLSCKKQEVPSSLRSTKEADNTSEGKNPFRNMKKLPQPGDGASYLGNNENTNQRQKQPCKTEIITKTVAFDEQLLLAPGADVIYLGSVLDAGSLPTGSYRPIIPIKKRPIKISISLQGVNGGVEKLTNATLNDTRQAISNMLNQAITGEQPSEIVYNVNQIYSEDQLRLAIGANFSLNKLADIKTSFNFNDNNQKTRVVAKILQKYYTVDMSIPDDGIFVEETPDPAKFGPYSPVYISSLTYGRMGLFFLESAYSINELSTALEGTLTYLTQAGITTNGANISPSYKDILNASMIKVFTTGGSGEAAVEAIRGYDGFVNFIKSGGKYSQNSRGTILSYQLRNLSDYTIFQTKLTSTYEVKTCTPIPTFQNGQFVKNDDTGELFIFMESKLRRIPIIVLNKLFHCQTSDIAHYSNTLLQNTPTSTPISHNSELIQSFFNGDLYLKENNTIRLIPDMAIRLKYHFNYGNSTTKFFLGSYEIGTPIQ
ncbi:MAG: thiol-activated cytolysin family protein [Sphingobacteriaceae bacterium]|nr:MAG: hypothetical protein E6Q66_01250 [Pedobacter sp.]